MITVRIPHPREARILMRAPKRCFVYLLTAIYRTTRFDLLKEVISFVIY